VSAALKDSHGEDRVRETIRTLEGSKIGDIARYGRGRPGLIPLWFGEGDLPTPAFICDAASQALKEGRTFYTAGRGVQELREALKDYSEGLYGRPLSVERIRVTPSGMAAIQIGLQALVSPGSNVVLVSPVWPNATAVVRAHGGEAREVPLDRRSDGRWVLDLDKLFAAIDDKTVALFINTPGNPTGWMASEAEIAAILKEARRRGIWIMADEVYSRMVYGRNAAPSFLEVAEPGDKVLVVNSFSKTWAMTGWRLGWLTMPEFFNDYMDKIGEINTSSTSMFVQYAGVTAVRDGEPFLAEQLSTMQTNRDLVMRRLSQLPRVKIDKPEAAFYAWFGVEGEPDSEALARKLVDQANVGIAPGAAFGKGGEGWLRLCFACSTPLLDKALDQIIPVLR
jgi:aspartate aminotransferase